MGLKTSQLNSSREEFDFPYLGESLHITYNPQGMTPALERRINQAINGATEARAEALVFMLKSMLVDWDLTKTVEVDGAEKDVPFGVEDEDMMDLPIKFLGDVIQAIVDEIKSVTAGNSSGGGSLQTAS